MRNRVKYAAVVAAPVLAMLAFAAPAHANSGQMKAATYYQTVAAGTRQSDIEANCGCSGSTTTVDGNDKQVSYTADNSTFAWNITIVIVHYHQTPAGTWQARDWKERYSPTRAPYEYVDDINYTG